MICTPNRAIPIISYFYLDLYVMSMEDDVVRIDKKEMECNDTMDCDGDWGAS